MIYRTEQGVADSGRPVYSVIRVEDGAIVASFTLAENANECARMLNSDGENPE